MEKNSVGFWGRFANSLFTSSIDRANANRRGITNYQPSPVEGFFENDYGPLYTVASGSSKEYRNKAIQSFINVALNHNYSVLVLHENNKDLANKLTQAYQNTINYWEVSKETPSFEPFWGWNQQEIANLVLESAPKDYDIKHNARYYLEGIAMLLKASGRNTTFKLFSTCPHMQLFDRIDKLGNKGTITDAQGNEIRSRLMMGQTENFKIESYLYTLKQQIEPVLYSKSKARDPTNVMRIMSQLGVVCIDVNSSMNELYLNLLVTQIKMAVAKGRRFCLVYDSIVIGSNEKLKTLLEMGSETFPYMVTGDDVFSMLGGKMELFNTLLGNAKRMLIFKHPSGTSAEKWAEVIGRYEKKEESYSNSKGKSYQSPFSIWSSPNYNQTTNINQKREYVVQPELISRMGYDEAYILSGYINELAYVRLLE